MTSRLRLTRRGAISRAFALVLVSVACVGCADRAAFIGDPAFALIVPSTDEFVARLERSWRAVGARSEVVWLSGDDLGASDVEDRIGTIGASTVVLSPVLSIHTDDLSRAYPDTTFLYVSSRAVDQPNAVGFRFDATEAIRRAGTLVGSWILAEPGRSVVLVAATGPELTRREAEAFVRALTDSIDIDFDQVWVEPSISREELGARIREEIGSRSVSQAGERLAVVMAGDATPRVLEFLRGGDELLGVRHGRIGPSDPRVLFAIRDDAIHAIDTYLRRAPADERTVVVESTLDTVDSFRPE